MTRTREKHFWRDPKTGHAHIGTKYTDDIGGYGPVAEVYRDGDWFRIMTDCYEGSVMLLPEAIPDLIKELRRLLKAEGRKAK